MKGAALLLAKLLVSAVLLAYLLSITDTAALQQRLRSADPLLLWAAAACYFGMVALAAWRWQLLLQTLGVKAPLRRLGSSYLVATFFNNFLPSNIGGDVVRVRDGSRLTGSTTASLAVVGIDRILGFAALYALAAAAFAFGGPAERELAGARAVLAGLALLFSSLAYLYFKPGTTRRLLSAARLDRFPWLLERFERAQRAVHGFRASLGTVVVGLAVGLVMHAILVLYYLSIARALGIPLTVSAAFLMVSLCTLLQAVPISFNGWGLREGLFTVYFSQVGLPRDCALAFSILGAGLSVALSLSGAVAWLARRGSNAPDSPAA